MLPETQYTKMNANVIQHCVWVTDHSDNLTIPTVNYALFFGRNSENQVNCYLQCLINDARSGLSKQLND